METTLTLSIDQNVVEHAEIYAKNTSKTVSQLVEEYLQSISSKTQNKITLGPITSQLTGIIKLDNNENYKNILTDSLMEKYL